MKVVVVLGSSGRLGSLLVSKLLEEQDTIVIGVDSSAQQNESIRLINLGIDVTKLDQIGILTSKIRELCSGGGTNNFYALINAIATPDSRSKQVENFRQSGFVPREATYEEYLEKARSCWASYASIDFMAHYETNVVGFHNVFQQIYDLALSAKSFLVVNITSQYSKFPPNQNLYSKLDKFTYKPPGYSASKAALDNYTIYLSKLFFGTDVRFVGVSLGVILDNQNKDFEVAYKKETNIGRMMEISEAVEIVMSLLSPRFIYMSGTIIPAHGGFGR